MYIISSSEEINYSKNVVDNAVDSYLFAVAYCHR
jgi:hypothetical protein